MEGEGVEERSLDMEEKKKVTKYTALYMPLGIGVGSAIGSAKDKEMSEKMMEISRIEDVPDSADKMIYALDKTGEEKEYRVDEKCFASEKFVVGDRVAEETDGRLVSLETK